MVTTRGRVPRKRVRRGRKSRALRTPEEVARLWRILADNALPATYNFIAKEEERVFVKSQEDVPVLSGDLRRSGRIEAQSGPYNAVVDVRYGNDDVEYALFVHESHASSRPKYLQDPFKKNRRRMSQRLLEHLRRVVFPWR